MNRSCLNTVRVLFAASLNLLQPSLRIDVLTGLINKNFIITPFRERTHTEFDNLEGERSAGLPYIQVVVHPKMLKKENVGRTLKEVVKKLNDYVEWE
tara:strand:+ start:15235 stop:15525 length:291 start_codon:yes stop_codon:yes gene_type:complete